jgi:hypothetical protein
MTGIPIRMFDTLFIPCAPNELTSHLLVVSRDFNNRLIDVHNSQPVPYAVSIQLRSLHLAGRFEQARAHVR